MGRYLFVCCGILVVLVLLSITLVKYDVVGAGMMVRNKEFIAALKALIEIVVVVGGAFLAYVKLFAGRTFSAKAEIECNNTTIAAPNNLTLHVLTITLINTGSITIVDPVANVRVTRFAVSGVTRMTEDEHRPRPYFKKKEEGKKEKDSVLVLDPGGKADFTVANDFDHKIWSINYEITISAQPNHSWNKEIRVANQFTEVHIVSE